MSKKRKSEKWYMIQWCENDCRDVVSWRSVVSPPQQVDIGKVADVVDRKDGETKPAKLVASSRDRDVLIEQISPVKLCSDLAARAAGACAVAGPSARREHDYSASGSSWVPSGGTSSSDSEEEEQDNKIKVERYTRSYSRNSSRVLKPCHRANAIKTIINKNHKRKQDDRNKNEEIPFVPNKKSSPDSTEANKSSNILAAAPELAAANCIEPDTIPHTIINEIIGMKRYFIELFGIIKEVKESLRKEYNLPEDPNEIDIESPAKCQNNNFTRAEDVKNEQEPSIESDRSQSVESNRSDDNVLITNKYDNIAAKSNILGVHNNNLETSHEDEWIPIGSGKTLIHKEKFRRVNFKSYTYATRTLLLAVFPRRILATHSLTGKRSPAFQNKPAKMCLDPKIVTDVINEVTDRFHVKENLVRSIITTKCADEAKMYKMRMRRKSTIPKNQENITPDPIDQEEGANIGANQTC